jgi:hypothetical protein
LYLTPPLEFAKEAIPYYEELIDEQGLAEK